MITTSTLNFNDHLHNYYHITIYFIYCIRVYPGIRRHILLRSTRIRDREDEEDESRRIVHIEGSSKLKLKMYKCGKGEGMKTERTKNVCVRINLFTIYYVLIVIYLTVICISLKLCKEV